MQGLVDFSRFPVWKAGNKELSGTSKVIGEETYKIVIAMNGYIAVNCKAKNAKSKIEITDKEKGLAVLSLDAKENAEIEWSVKFK